MLFCKALICTLSAALLLLCGCLSASGPVSVAPGKSETIKTHIREMGFRRSYRVHMPSEVGQQRRLPLLVMLHGAFETAKSMERLTGFSDLADKERFIVVYPNGIGLFGFLQHWNAGHCCGKAQNDGIDDTAFLETVLDDVFSRFPVDENRVYLVGHSNGGMLAYLFAARKPDRLAGLAVVSASIGSRESGKGVWQRIARPKSGLPLLVIHGQNDETVPYDGGPSKNHKNRKFTSVADAIDFWAAVNQCAGTPEQHSANKGRVSVKQWNAGSHPLVLHTIHDWAHDWPCPRVQPQAENSRALEDYAAAGVIWRFFQGLHNPYLNAYKK